MIKKTFLSSMIFISSASSLFASPTSSYVGGSLGVGGYSQISNWRGLNANFFGGMGKRFGVQDVLYLGGELNAGINTYLNSLGFGASILPGVMLTRSTMLYGRLGLAANVYKHSVFHSYSDLATSHTVYVENHSRSQLNLATVVGLGVQTAVAKNWDARLEYTRTGNNQSGINLGLVYKFD